MSPFVLVLILHVSGGVHSIIIDMPSNEVCQREAPKFSKVYAIDLAVCIDRREQPKGTTP